MHVHMKVIMSKWVNICHRIQNSDGEEKRKKKGNKFKWLKTKFLTVTNSSQAVLKSKKRILILGVPHKNKGNIENTKCSTHKEVPNRQIKVINIYTII